MQFSSIWPIDRILSVATTPGLSGLEAMAIKAYIPQSSSNTGTSPTNCSVSYQNTLFFLGGGVLYLSRGAVSAFYSPSRLGNQLDRGKESRPHTVTNRRLKRLFSSAVRLTWEFRWIKMSKIKQSLCGRL